MLAVGEARARPAAELVRSRQVRASKSLAANPAPRPDFVRLAAGQQLSWSANAGAARGIAAPGSLAQTCATPGPQLCRAT